MKYIAKFAGMKTDVQAATEAHESEFYRRPCNIINGRSLGRFVETEQGMGKFIDGKVDKINDKWLKRATGDLFYHLKTNTNFKGLSGINSFCTENSVPREALRDENNHGFSLVMGIGAGYTAFISQDGRRVLAESYVACSGNTVIVIHKEDETILYVNSARHGIPHLAEKFKDMEVAKEIMYDSWRTDKEWHEFGLKNPNETSHWEEVGEEIEANFAWSLKVKNLGGTLFPPFFLWLKFLDMLA